MLLLMREEEEQRMSAVCKMQEAIKGKAPSLFSVARHAIAFQMRRAIVRYANLKPIANAPILSRR